MYLLAVYCRMNTLTLKAHPHKTSESFSFQPLTGLIYSSWHPMQTRCHGRKSGLAEAWQGCHKNRHCWPAAVADVTSDNAYSVQTWLRGPNLT